MREKHQISQRLAPALSKVFVIAFAVAPVVTTSSIIAMVLPFRFALVILLLTMKAPRRFLCRAARPDCCCGGLSNCLSQRLKVSGKFSALQTSLAISLA